MSKHFCCCIPVRFGVFIISLITLLGSAAASFVLWWAVARPNDVHVLKVTNGNTVSDLNLNQTNLRIAIIVAAVHATIIALVSLMGFIGSVFRKRGLVAIYSTFLWVSLLVNLAIGTWLTVQLVRNIDSDVDNCKTTVKNGNGQDVKTDCINRPLSIGLTIGVFVVEFFFMFYLTIIVNRYKNQLTAEQRWDAKHVVNAPVPESHPAPMISSSVPMQSYGAPYYPVAQGDNSYPFTGHGTYDPYNQKVTV